MADIVFSLDLGNVPPAFAVDDSPDAALAQSVSDRELRRALDRRGIQRAHLTNIIGGQVCSVMGTPNWPSSLTGHVGQVRSLIAQEQVIGTDAWRVVATVADEQTCGDRAVGKSPCNPMRAVSPVLPVSIAGSTAAPDPTPITLLDLRPEIGAVGDPGSPPVACTGASTKPLSVTGIRQVPPSTLFAISRNRPAIRHDRSIPQDE